MEKTICQRFSSGSPIQLLPGKRTIDSILQYTQLTIYNESNSEMEIPIAGLNLQGGGTANVNGIYA